MKIVNKKLLVAILCTISVIITIYAFSNTIYALFTDKERVNNNLSVGYNNIEILDDFIPPEEIKSGTSFHKDVKIKNIGQCSCYARVKVLFTDGDIMQYCTIDYNNTDFIYDETDGYYYYKKVLNIDDISESLFTTVKINNNAPSGDLKDFDILVYAESYQAYGFNDYQTAWQNFRKNMSS